MAESYNGILTRLLQEIAKYLPLGNITAAQMTKISASANGIFQQQGVFSGRLDDYIHQESNILIENFTREAEFQRVHEEQAAKKDAQKERWQQGWDIPDTEKARLEKEWNELRQKEAQSYLATIEKAEKMDDAAAKILPGLQKKLSETSAEELRAVLFEEPEEIRKKKARELQPYIEESLAADRDHLGILKEGAALLVKLGKKNHHLQSDTLHGQVDEIHTIKRSGKGTKTLDEHLSVVTEMLEKIGQFEERVERKEQKLEVVKEAQKDREIAQVVELEKLFVEQEKLELAEEAKEERIEAKEEKDTAREEKEAGCRQYLEAVADEVDMTAAEGKPVEEQIAQFARKVMQDKALMEDPKVNFVEGQLRKNYPEIFAEVEKELAQQEEKQLKPLDGKTLPEQGKETAKDKDFDAQIKHLGAVFQPHSGQTENRSNWQQRIDPPTPPDKGGGPDKGGNGRGR